MNRVHRRVFGTAVALLGVALSSYVYSCFDEQYDSVHFGSTEPDFSAPPSSLVITNWGEKGIRYTNGWYDPVPWERDPVDARRRTEFALLQNRARCEEQCGHFSEALQLHRRLLNDPAADVSFERDRIEVLKRAGAVSSEVLKRYLKLTVDSPSREALLAMSRDKTAGYLRPHALYAYIAQPSGDDRMDSISFERLAKEFPNSPRAEPALMMAARVLLEDDREGENYKKEDIARARDLLARLVTTYPKSRFRNSALGWVGRCEYLMRRYSEAEKAYQRQLAARPSTAERYSAYFSIAMCRARTGDRAGAFIAWLSYAKAAPDRGHYVEALLRLDDTGGSLTPEDAKVVGNRLVARPELLGAYLDFRLYHTENPDVEGLLRLADRALELHPQTLVAAELCARISEMQYLYGKPLHALKWARKALAQDRSLKGRADLALYMEGAVLRRMGRYRQAENSLATLVRRFPESYLAGAARENLALVYEATSRLDKALDQYIELRYDADIAYMLDMRMSTEQVRKYAASRRPSFDLPYTVMEYYDRDGAPTYTIGDVVRYSLGVRLLRDFKLDKARIVFQSFPAKTLRALSLPANDWWSRDDEVLHNPLNTIHNLKVRMNRVANAGSYDAKAEAQYALGAYIYNNRSLLFYNKPLWGGQRAFNLDFYYNDKIAKPADTQAVRRHCYEHECLNRSRKIFLSVLEKWPKSKVAPKALYSAACATERLSNMNVWWRLEDDRVHLGDKAITLMQMLAKDHPNHPLASHAAKYVKVWSNPDWVAPE